MTDTITAGIILVEGGTHLPNSLLLQSDSGSSGWSAVKDTRACFEKTIQDAGWTLFFMAGEIKTTVFGFDQQKSLRTALRRLIANVKAQHCNCIEITQVTGRSFLNLPFVSVFAHVRHIQQGLLFSGHSNSI